MDRRSFVTGLVVGGAVGAGATAVLNQPKKEAEKTVAAPAINKDRVEIAMVSTWPRDFPGLGTGAQRFARNELCLVALDGRSRNCMTNWLANLA